MKREKSEFIAPVITCPSCSGNCIPVAIEMICEKCDEAYDVDITIFADNVKLVDISSENIDRYMLFLLNNKKEEALESGESESDDGDVFKVVYKGQILETLKQMKKDYNFSSLLLVLKFITEGFMFILNQMREMSGEKFYLVDNNGAKSAELKKAFLRNAYDAFNAERDSLIVSAFMKSLGIETRIVNVKENLKGEENVDGSDKK